MLHAIRTKWRAIWARDQAEPIDPPEMLTRTYRFLRLAMAMMALAIIVSMLIEKSRAPGWEESISAYYYTAARPIFTGSMVAIGGFLLSIKGRTKIEDISLNLAGMMAPLVPLIPPNQASETDGSVISRVGFNVTDRQHRELLVNNMTAVLVVAIASFVVAMVIGKVKGNPVKFRPHDKIGLLIAGTVAALGVVLYVTVEPVRENAHGLAAGLMFGFLWPAVVANAYGAQSQRYRTWYATIAVAMPLFAGVVGLAIVAPGSWRHAVLALELLELTPFVVYWVVQTLEQWDVGVEEARTVAPITQPPWRPASPRW